MMTLRDRFGFSCLCFPRPPSPDSEGQPQLLLPENCESPQNRRRSLE